MVERIAALAGGGPAGEGAAARDRDRQIQILDSWSNRHRRDLLRSLRELAVGGAVELAALPATAAVLPLLPSAKMAALQVGVGLQSFERRLEHPPVGLWLPGGAIAPEGALQPLFDQDNWNRVLYRKTQAQSPGTDDLLREFGIRYTFVGEHALHGGRPATNGGPSPLDCHVSPQGLTLLARHAGLAEACLDTAAGFPSHLAYSTDAGAGPHDPDAAATVAKAQALQAIGMAKALLDAHAERTGRAGSVVLPIDARIFTTWHEGPLWLCELVRAAWRASLPLRSGAEAIHQADVLGLDVLHPSSWEVGGDFRAWRAPNTTWYWEVVSNVLDSTESLIDRFAMASHPLIVRALAQVTREALLLTSGEWSQMLGSGGEVRDYAAERVRSHYERYRLQAEGLSAEDFGENFDTALLERYEAMDNPFEGIDYGWAGRLVI
ncbi:MAG: DUF1957 domain-containing protein, partial [Cyanobacteria bacterium REEB65]|nr:DUF1957 domain-containing protein [Cyanobacteria bacterium REEB65]